PAMIRNHESLRPCINRPPRIVSGQHTLDHNRPGPDLTNPPHVLPCYGRAREGRVHVDKGHRPLSRNHNVRKTWQTAVQKKSHEPTWPHQDLWQERNLRPHTPA